MTRPASGDWIAMRRYVEFWGCVVLVWALYSNAVRAQTLDFSTIQEGVKYIATQGGLTIALLAVGWAYRRDLLRFSEDAKREAEQRKAEAKAIVEEKAHHVDTLVELVKANTSYMATSAASMGELVETVKTLAKDVADRRSGDERRRN